jgi:hypothetical protein
MKLNRHIIEVHQTQLVPNVDHIEQINQPENDPPAEILPATGRTPLMAGKAKDVFFFLSHMMYFIAPSLEAADQHPTFDSKKINSFIF